MVSFKFDPADIFNSVAKGAGDVAKGVVDAASTAGNVVGGVVENASKATGGAIATIVDNASSVGDAIVSSDAGKAVGVVAETIGSAGTAAINTVGNTAMETMQVAQKTIADIATTIQENSPAARLKRARMNAFRDGMNQGVYLAGENRFNFYYAYVATLCFFLRCDGEFSAEEEDWLANSLSHLRFEGGLPDNVKEKLRTIAGQEDISFDNAKEYLDKISLRSLDSISEYIQLSIELDGEVTSEEIEAQKLFTDYMALRFDAACEVSTNLMQEAMENSLEEYEKNYDRINEEFEEKTKLQGSDWVFLFGATFLQVARVLIINHITHIEAAGRGNRNEQVLHDFQNKLLKGFDDSSSSPSSYLYASTQQIITTPGVPYDVTAGGAGLLAGANHRFSTLGHDPVLGLIFGTANIMTNSITCVADTGIGVSIPSTYSVSYEGRTGPHIIQSMPVGTSCMLSKSGARLFDEPNAACAAFIKQVLHIGTDLYTPAGIQVPLSGFVLDKAHVERLTRYVSMGDILKVGAQAGFATFINFLIAALHGSSIIFKDDGSAYAWEMHQARTKKIILISNAFATSSSVVQAAITKNPRCLDLGGAIVLASRLFSDVNFINKLKEEYVNTGLNEVYEQRANSILC